MCKPPDNHQWVRSADLISEGKGRLLAAIAALDKQSAKDLTHDLSSDEFRFFNLSTGKFREGTDTDDLPTD